MSDEMQIEGKSYISSKRAAEITGYAQDYIGQLARKSLIEATRIGGLWYVSLESLQGYKRKAEEYKPEPPQRITTPDPSTLIFFDGKEYVSAARAAEVTGYTQDYVGQLARAGTINSRQVGNRWYVERESIVSHKREKDALLAAVQAESVGLKKVERPQSAQPEYQAIARDSGSSPVMNYYAEGGDLLPVIHTDTILEPLPVDENKYPALARSEFVESNNVPIRSVPIRKTYMPLRKPVKPAPAPREVVLPRNRSITPLLLGAAATIVIVLSVGYASILKQNSVYASAVPAFPKLGGLSASVDTAFEQLGNMIEPYLTRELDYQRQDTQ